MPAKRTPIEKRDQAPPPEVQHLATAKGAQFPPGDMLIASPLAIAEIVERVPAGSVLTLPTLRAYLAAKFGAGYTCPLTTGIFLRIAAEAAEMEGEGGRGTPYWRVVREDGKLLDKLPGGPAAQAKHLAAEGVACRAAGSKSWRVEQLARHLWTPR